jgi:hypothetical protein
VNSFYINYVRGIVQSIELDEGMITQNHLSTMEILLKNNNNLTYAVVIMDSRLQIFSKSPDTLPRSWFKIAKEQSGTVQFHLRV